ncbi:hypothetical protein ACFP1I_30500 [Dyadobacter subterraneus]|uniref:Outer membrane protein beta-barrel domain-containing protein n=1 Tax=Dyadobacter subterraneus TaxID=2773304 RepID=A0ABR9W854_9BACT|nr:hypothetical protein [Dyadobacter subterraneus]MBE9461648.1 hypothetical protein [Dyadobacter subterraneus]
MKFRIPEVLFIFIAVLFLTKANGQNSFNDFNVAVSQRTADTIETRAFSKMVVGQDDVPSIANYVSFIPTDGRFSLSGNYFFKINNDTSGQRRRHESFAVGFSAAGSVIGGNVATLFQEAKLNSGTDLGLRLSWRMNTPKIESLQSESLEMVSKREKLLFERNEKIDSIRNELLLLPEKVARLNYAISEGRRNLKLAAADTAALRKAIRACTTDACRLKNTESLLSLKNKIFKDRQSLQTQIRDSVTLNELAEIAFLDPSLPWARRTPKQQFLTTKFGLKINMPLEDLLIDQMQKQYEDKIYDIEMSRPIAGMHLNWLSAVLNWNRKTYRTYNNALAFDSSIVKNSFNGMTLGLQANFYTFNRPFRKSSLLTIGLLYKKNINLDDLSTSRLVDETVIINGSTSRKTSTEYNVYTDPIENFSSWNVPVDYYRFFGKDLNFGWHAYALAALRSDKKQLYDVGAGFILGLNSSGAKRLLNIELFVTYKDIKKDVFKDDLSGWKQLQLGVSAAIPFMIFKN